MGHVRRETQQFTDSAVLVFTPLRGNQRCASVAGSSENIWGTFLAALGAEHREHQQIRGASGLVHPVQAIGVDDKTKRIILVSAEYNPRIAALMRGDVQATMPGTRVLVARPIAIDLAHATRFLFNNTDGKLNTAKFFEFVSLLMTGGNQAGDQIKARYASEVAPMLASVSRSSLPIRAHILHAFEQATGLDWEGIRWKDYADQLQAATDIVNLLRAADNLEGDRKAGICPVPIYELSDRDWEVFTGSQQIDLARERLKELDIYQYFFPPKDQLALGLIDSGLASSESINQAIHMAEQDGHQPSSNSLVGDVGDMPELLEALKDCGYVAEGEFSYEVTEAGRTIRRTVKVRPSEGLIQKLINRLTISFSMNPRDLF
jgi:hypothetical protein